MKIVALQNFPAVDELIERFGARHLPFVLDSSLSNDGLGEWSFFGADPFLVFEGKDGRYVEYQTSGSAEPRQSTTDDDATISADGLVLLRELMAKYSSANMSGIPFVGGAVGFIAYDYGRQVELLPDLTDDDRGIPDIHFGFYDGIAALNHQTGELSLIALGIRADEDVVLDELQAIVSAPPKPVIAAVPQRDEWEWNIERADYLQA
ncbi:MAG TPA: hypothetical protein DCR32_03100, partial [Opitutae bacterium]|nr:hypothetical protein [Opitutae bacterium]